MPQVKDGRYRSVLERMLKRYDRARRAWSEIRKEGAEDMRYVSGNGWPEADARTRRAAGRPVLWFDELSQYTNQLINQVRQHKRAVEATAVGNGANDKKAEYRANRIRQIEYRSNAQQAYTIAFENAVQRSYGFWRIRAQYAKAPKTSGGDGSGFNQELLIEPCVNPELITPDPDIVKPTGEDMKFLFNEEKWLYDDYTAKFPDAKIQSFDGELTKDSQGWMDEQGLRVAEYWEVEPTERTLGLYKTANGWVEIYADDAKALAQVKGRKADKTRQVEVPVVTSYLTNGFEVLGMPTKWPATRIPFVCVFGKILYLREGTDGPTKKVIMSLVRAARDPAMFYSYCRTSESEQIGQTTKNPYLAYRGQVNDDEKNEIAKSLHEPVAVLTYGALTEATGQQVLPPMQRNSFEPAIQALEIAAESSRRSIQAAMGGSTLPTSALRKNEKSGVALKEIKNAEQVGSYHFIDAYEMGITYGGDLLNELIPFYDDTARDVTVRDKKSEPKVVRINDPNVPDGQDEPIMVAEGDYDITLSTGPSYDSEREAAADFAESLVGSPAFPLIGDLVVKLRNLGPIGDEIADRLTPPQFRKPKDGAGPDPQQVQQQMQQAKAMIDGLTKELNAKNDLIETDTIKLKGQVELEKVKQAGQMAQSQADNAARLEIERMKIVAQLLATRAKLESAHTQILIDAAASELDRELARDAAEQAQQNAETDRQTQTAQADADRQQEADLAAMPATSTDAATEPDRAAPA